MHFLFFLLCSCEVLSVHIFDECDASGLLDNSMCHSSHMDLFEDKIWTQEVHRRWSLCGWPYISSIFRRPCL
jgi:hypothetical protein